VGVARHRENISTGMMVPSIGGTLMPASFSLLGNNKTESLY
jgi:hypothetical protein